MHLFYSACQERIRGTCIGLLLDGAEVHYTLMHPNRNPEHKLEDLIYLGEGKFLKQGRPSEWILSDIPSKESN